MPPLTDISSSLALALANLDGPQPDDYAKTWRSYVEEAGDMLFISPSITLNKERIVSLVGSLSLREAS